MINGNLDYIDYKVKAENSPNDGRYFRVYVDNNTSKECFLSPDRTLRKFSKNVSIPYKEMVKFLNDLRPNHESEDKIAMKIRLLLNDVNTSAAGVKRKPSEILRYIKYDVKELQEIYKDKCMARKEINEDVIAGIELVLEKENRMTDWHIEPAPNIKTFLDDLIGLSFNYGGIIKDRKTGRILADNIYENVRYQGALGESFIKAFGSESRGYGISCDSGREKYLEVCNQKMIEEFFKKDRK